MITGMNNAAADQKIMQLPAIIMGSDGLCSNGCQAWFAGVVHATANFLLLDPASIVSAEDIPPLLIGLKNGVGHAADVPSPGTHAHTKHGFLFDPRFDSKSLGARSCTLAMLTEHLRR